ncbi:hypothetical protein [Polymorphobacter megasporae]|uniref:hypothetical protein n=1 Tax=Glacieibacterium megasporae TaxID=2835787 RepID=UPI001C1DDED6|nr:hypothetical protein [Polymorphobacter megasporae]UAJ12551.1 hypothetical protein KTC28_18485 [Polymorphobacter megasporae]
MIEPNGDVEVRELKRDGRDYAESEIANVNTWMRELGPFGHINFGCAVKGMGVEVVASAINHPHGPPSLIFSLSEEGVLGKRLVN